MARKTVSDRAKTEALEKTLRGMFGRLQARPTPDRLMSIVDQLEAQQVQEPLKKSG